MEVIEDISGLRKLPGPLHLAIGVFDGLHLGHRAVIEDAARSAAEAGGGSVVVTFDPHPVEVLNPGKAPRLLTDTPHKLRLLERELGVGTVLVVKFDAAFAALSGEAFVDSLLGNAPASGIVRISVGEDWRFGRARGGDLALLEKMGRERGFTVSGLGTVELEGTRVSSTRVREALTAGDLATAARLLGRDYSVHGKVELGRQLGRTLGFPTANLSVRREQLPPPGVYATRTRVGDEVFGGVANLGVRPTVEDEGAELRLEVHLFGLDREIYGEDVELEFVAWVREERRFDGLEALKEQIARDVKAAKRALVGE